jgi:DNA-binding CsgD family transcriptional regulator
VFGKKLEIRASTNACRRQRHCWFAYFSITELLIRAIRKPIIERTLLKNAIDQLKELSRLDSLALEPVIVPRMDKLPVIVRIWPFEGAPGQDVRAILTLNALGPRPGPSAAILAKTFRLTPSEAKVACIIARGAPPDIAARELKISRETARNQLKSVFAKTDTHRQSALVALLLQVE